MDALSNWTKHLDAKTNTCIQTVFVDFSKAFDMMNPTILDSKLSELSVNNSLRKLINSFLTSRSACVTDRATGERSSELSVSRGVPQGTILGLPLWSVYINDLPQKIADASPSSEKTIYADDVTSYQPVYKQDAELTSISRTCRLMSTPLHCNQLLTPFNDMTLNTAKTKTMNVSPSLNIISDLGLNVDSKQIEEVSEFKLLGVMIDTHLSFTSHVETTYSRAKSRLHALLTLKRFGVDEPSLIRFY